tara:strand:+ start:1079 stop:1648 length:570 start_codon:yes stop_codon:yes gene_type:complete
MTKSVTAERKLTNRQREFCKLIVEGIYSNAECARKAGFSPNVAPKTASVLLNGKDYPHVVDHVKELREERERQYGVTLIGQMKRLSELSRGAEDVGQYSAAINAEKIRSALGGLTIDRRETVNRIDDMTREEIMGRLADLQKRYPHVVIDGEFKDVTRSRSELLDSNPKETTEKLLRLEVGEQSLSRDA